LNNTQSTINLTNNYYDLKSLGIIHFEFCVSFRNLSFIKDVSLNLDIIYKLPLILIVETILMYHNNNIINK